MHCMGTHYLAVDDEASKVAEGLEHCPVQGGHIGVGPVDAEA